MQLRFLLSYQSLKMHLKLGFFFMLLCALWACVLFSKSYIPQYSSSRYEVGHSRDVNQTLGFEKIFVINLPFRTDRRDALELMAAATDMKLDFSRAVKGEEVEEVALVYVRSFYTANHKCLAQNIQGTFEKRSE
jgi:hypothetical protein